MRKYYFIFASIIFLICCSSGVFAQDETIPTQTVSLSSDENETEEVSINFRNAYEQYLLTLNLYGKAHEEYVTAKSQYLRTNTEKSKTQALDAAINAEQSRSDVVISYLKMIYAKLIDTKGISDDIISKLKIRIDDEILWYEKSKVIVMTSVDFKSFNIQSEKDSSRIRSTTNNLVYSQLINISHAKVDDYDKRTYMIIKGIEDKIDQIKSEERDEYKLSEDEMIMLQRWIDEVEISKGEAENKINEVYELIVSDQINNEKIYNRSIGELENASKYLREALSKILEVIYEIKNET